MLPPGRRQGSSPTLNAVTEASGVDAPAPFNREAATRDRDGQARSGEQGTYQVNWKNFNAKFLRMNPVNRAPALFLDKAQSFQARWPWLTIVEPYSKGRMLDK
jgi:hypothetical protein